MSENNEDEKGIDGDEGGEAKFVEVDGAKFVDDGTGKPKIGDDGKPTPYVESQRFSETPEARKTRLDKQTEQHRKKHPELYDEPNKKGKKGEKSGELDYGQKAYLIAKGIEDADEIALVQSAMESSGKSLENVLGSSWFKGDLKDMRDAKVTANAVPGKGNRSGQSAANTVEYWIAKGELPPNTPDNRTLRAQVVNARMAREKKSDQFTDNPVVGK